MRGAGAFPARGWRATGASGPAVAARPAPPRPVVSARPAPPDPRLPRARRLPGPPSRAETRPDRLIPCASRPPPGSWRSSGRGAPRRVDSGRSRAGRSDGAGGPRRHRRAPLFRGPGRRQQTWVPEMASPGAAGQGRGRLSGGETALGPEPYGYIKLSRLYRQQGKYRRRCGNSRKATAGTRPPRRCSRN